MRRFKTLSNPIYHSGGDAKKLEIAPHHEVVDNHDGSYTVTLGKPEHFAVKIDGHPVLRAEFI
jgi:hypothetical protein